MGIIAIVILGLVGCFSYAAGWLSPGSLTQARMIDGFQQVNGVHPGFRRNHTKGVCIAGSFESNGQGTRLSRAVVFQAGRTPVVGRFALAVGKPDAVDGPQVVRSMALSFRPPNGEEWRTGMNDIPVFVVNTPKAFYEQLLASQPDPATGKPDPAARKAFLASHPETVRAIQAIGAKPFSTGFANASYNGLDAFRFINAADVSTPVRWSMVAVEPFEPEKPDQAAATDKNYLFDAVIARIQRGPLQWHLIVTIGQPADPTNDATVAWPNDRERVDVGTLSIDHVEGEAPGNCRDINFHWCSLPVSRPPTTLC
jgi:catalase